MPKTLLLADDSVVIQKLVGLSFANEDVDIVTTDNGDDAVVMARDLKPDVVLADVVMPGKSGYEVCEALKQDPTLAHIPVLLLTGTFEAFDEARATATGANGHITKPFEAQALVDRVNEVMTASASAIPASAPPPADYDFFDADVTTLDSGDSNPQISTDAASPDLAPAIDTDSEPLFGSPGGEGGAVELDTENGGLALGESVEPPSLQNLPEDESTIVVLPESPRPLPPSVGDPLAGFEDDFARAEESIDPPPVPPTAVELDPVLDHAFGSSDVDPAATVITAFEDDSRDGDATLDVRIAESQGIEQEFEDLTVHTPASAIDQDAAAAPSPIAVSNIGLPERPADAVAVANLDVSLAEPIADATPPTEPSLDLGPTNISADELDFAFDVSEQVPANDLNGPLGESFASQVDISESQILAGPADDSVPAYDNASHNPSQNASDGSGNPAAESVLDDSFAVGYDVSSSDLATAPRAEDAPMTNSFEARDDDSIAIGIESEFDDHLGETESEESADLAIPVAPAPETNLELGQPTPTSTGDERIADLSPLVEQRIQETLEKVAWEAFSDLSESIVKQVITRVEKIAWEVIPQMAETLVREEIRKMKGEKD